MARKNKKNGKNRRKRDKRNGNSSNRAQPSKQVELRSTFTGPVLRNIIPAYETRERGSLVLGTLPVVTSGDTIIRELHMYQFYGTRLGKIMQLWEFWDADFEVEYVPSLPLTEGGRVTMYGDRDIVDEPTITYGAGPMMGHWGAVSTPLTTPATCRMPPVRFLPPKYTSVSGAIEPRTYSHGFFAVNITHSSASSPGMLILHYDVRFHTPALENDVTPVGALRIDVTGAYNASPLPLIDVTDVNPTTTTTVPAAYLMAQGVSYVGRPDAYAAGGLTIENAADNELPDGSWIKWTAAEQSNNAGTWTPLAATDILGSLSSLARGAQEIYDLYSVGAGYISMPSVYIAPN